MPTQEQSVTYKCEYKELKVGQEIYRVPTSKHTLLLLHESSSKEALSLTNRNKKSNQVNL